MQPGPVKSLLKNCNDGISAISIPTLNRQLHLLPLLHSIMPLCQLEMQHICWLWEHHHKPCQIWRNRSTLLFHGHETKKHLRIIATTIPNQVCKLMMDTILWTINTTNPPVMVNPPQPPFNSNTIRTQ